MGKLNVSWRQSDFWPWAVAAFPREFRLAGHILENRGDPGDLSFTGYSVGANFSVARDGPPPVSMLFFRSKDSARALAHKSPLFSVCWEVLSDKPEGKRWLCFPDPPEKGWVDEAETKDPDLFSKYFRV
jgi:hypothetical protein